MKTHLLNNYYRLLARLAKGYLRKHSPYIIGINGSVGKTTCRTIIHQTLQKFLPDSYRVSTSKENFNGKLGFSLSVFEINAISPSTGSFINVLRTAIKKRYWSKKAYDCIILEYGINTPGEMKFLLNIVKPHIGVFTKMDSVHSEQFGDPQAIAQEESAMIKNTLEVAFLNSDDVYARQLYNMISINKFFYCTTKEELDQLTIQPHIRYENIKLYNDTHQLAATRMDSYNLEKHYRISTNLVGKENISYIPLAIAITEIVLYKIGVLKAGKRLVNKKSFHLHYDLIPGRSSIFHGLKKSIIFDSTYNASPKSMRKIIETSYTLKNELFPTYKLMLVLGDMRELGDFTETEHRKLAPVAMIADHIILVGKQIAYLQDELEKIGYNPKNIHHFPTISNVKKHLLKQLESSKQPRFITFKGSQNTIYLEELIKSVRDRRKYHKNAEKTKLCRQSDWRLKKKKQFLNNINNG